MDVVTKLEQVKRLAQRIGNFRLVELVQKIISAAASGRSNLDAQRSRLTRLGAIDMRRNLEAKLCRVLALALSQPRPRYIRVTALPQLTGTCSPNWLMPGAGLSLTRLRLLKID